MINRNLTDLKNLRKVKIKIHTSEGIEEKVLKHITKRKKKGKKCLGIAYGTDIHHCIYIGQRHYEGDFFKEVKWYHINQTSDKYLRDLQKANPDLSFIKVGFYGVGDEEE